MNSQSCDPELKAYFDHQLDIADADEASHCFSLKSDVLMRKFKPLHVSSSHTWETVHQIVVFQSLQQEILRIAHDGAGDHLGVHKTYHKVLSHFFLDKVKKLC